MKRIILIVVLLGAGITAWSQAKPVKIVFDVSSRDSLAYQSAVRHVTMMAKAYPESQFEVVVFGSALSMLLKDKSRVADGVENLTGMNNVSFKACEVTMKRHNVTKGDLIKGVDTVPDAILEIVTKQNEGWGYIKE